jgi:hypothetical protein
MPAFLIMLAVSIWFFDIWPFYSGNFRPLERRHDYNVYFYYENGNEEILGFIQGIDNCRFMAADHAKRKKIKDTAWTYRCCRVLRGNQCKKIEM